MSRARSWWNSFNSQRRVLFHVKTSSYDHESTKSSSDAFFAALGRQLAARPTDKMLFQYVFPIARGRSRGA